MSQDAHKTYRTLQVEYAPGLHLIFSIVSGFVLLKYGILPFIIFLTPPILLSYLNRPFMSVFNSKPTLWYVLVFLYFTSTILPSILYKVFYGDPLMKLLSEILIPVGSILISLFVWKFYNEDILQKEGWKNISNRWG